MPPSWIAGSGCHGTAWTFLPGQNGVLFPDGVGMRVGSGELDLRHVILEVHYDEAQDLAGLHDRSGVRLWAVKDSHAVRHRVGVLSVEDPSASLPHDLPPGQPDVEVAVHCPPGHTEVSRADARLRVHDARAPASTARDHDNQQPRRQWCSRGGWVERSRRCRRRVLTRLAALLEKKRKKRRRAWTMPASDTDPQDPEHWHIVVQDLINRHIYI